MQAQDRLKQAQIARDAAQWPVAIALYQAAIEHHPQLNTEASVQHNLGLSYYGAGQYRQAYSHCQKALQLNPQLWQAAVILAKCKQAEGEIVQADEIYQAILKAYPKNATAILGRADLAMNHLGNAVFARELVGDLADDPKETMNVMLTQIMSRLYDRDLDDSPQQIVADIQDFAKNYLDLSRAHPLLTPSTKKVRARRSSQKRPRPRVGLLSCQFHASPVYFLTIAGWRHVAQACDIVIFNRGHRQDWASSHFLDLSIESHDLQHQDPHTLAQTIAAAEIDVLYDLSGWMDPQGLQALSLKPAKQQFKWVGGQSVTTGLHCFDGWIGDAAQSPMHLQSLYTEPLINIEGGYASYTPPTYLPTPAVKKKNAYCVFSNPAKVSREFLKTLRTYQKPITFIHHQYRYDRVQDRIRDVLGQQASFVMPESHREALAILNGFQTMLDTFPYSSGLTAREALAMGTQIQVLRVGQLFCERHTATYSSLR